MKTTLLELAQPITPIGPDTKGQAVYERFQAEPDCLALAVVDAAGRPVGLVERHAFFTAMAAQYGRALYALRPISVLMNAAPLVVEGDQPGRVHRPSLGRARLGAAARLRGGR